VFIHSHAFRAWSNINGAYLELLPYLKVLDFWPKKLAGDQRSSLLHGNEERVFTALNFEYLVIANKGCGPS